MMTFKSKSLHIRHGYQDIIIDDSTMNVYGLLTQGKIQITENGLWKI